mmetsp:Transcript_33383/g.92185  ORF Transcript_33383/g.92185 Transcript_33383/m.92185 type:complete len:354 (-) Transcript_33383:78-1139(-)
MLESPRAAKSMERKSRWRRDRAICDAGADRDVSAELPPERGAPMEEALPTQSSCLPSPEPFARLVAGDPQAEHGDPREDTSGRPREARRRGRGRNTESFDPLTTLVRPDMRVLVGPKRERFGKTLRHDDVLVVPEFFCAENDWSLYNKLLEEMQELQRDGVQEAEWASWHEGCHLITKNPERAPSFQRVVERMTVYLDVEREDQATRFNWYKDRSDWKPFHHDSAAFNEHRAQHQNITVGASFGTERELAFRHARTGTLTYFPQTNGSLFTFGKDVNIRWKHGINAVPAGFDGSGRISIILWGRCCLVVDEDGSPPLLSEEMRGNAGYIGRQSCRDFLRGYCHAGAQCKLRHV